MTDAIQTNSTFSLRALAAILLLAICVDSFHLVDRDLWLDELWTMELSTGRGSAHLTIPFDQLVSPPPMTTQLANQPPARAVWSHMGDVAHPPLYFLILRGWMTVFGNSAIAVRTLSTLFMLGAVVLLYDIARQTIGATAAVWACVIFEITTPVAEYSCEVRNYALAMLLTLGVADVLLLIRSRGASYARAIALGTLVLASALTHYFALIPVIAFVGFLSVESRHKRSTLIGIVLPTLIATAVWAIAWGPKFVEQSHHFRTGSVTAEFLVRTDLKSWLLALAAIPIRLLIDAPATWAIVAAVGSAALLIICIVRARENAFAWAWFLSTVVGVALIDLARGTTQISFIRYTLLAVPPLCILIAAAGTRPRTRYLIVGVIVLCGFALPQIYSPPSSKWSVLARDIEANVGKESPPTLIFATPGKPDWADAYLYLATSHYSSVQPATIALIHASSVTELQSQQTLLLANPNAWLIVIGSLPMSPNDLKLLRTEASPDSPATIFRVMR